MQCVQFSNVLITLLSPKLKFTLDNPYMAAERLGENPVLCGANSTFLTSYAARDSCVVANSNASKGTLQTYGEPEFAPFLNFCSALSPNPRLDRGPLSHPQGQ
jgi:hypothetical protein